jgi:hypothetical protein
MDMISPYPRTTFSSAVLYCFIHHIVWDVYWCDFL